MIIRPHAVLFAFSLCLAPAFCLAQQPGQAQQPQRPAGAGTNIALIDISYVFKNHNGFKQRGEAIKKEVKDYEARVNDQKKGLNEKRNNLSTFKVGSPEYEKMEADIAREIANLEVEARLKRNEILEKEAKVYYETYQEVSQVVAAFCSRRQIGLVLRFDGEPIDPDDRASVFRGVNRPVVYQDHIDITEDILQMINAPRSANRKAPAQHN